MMFNNKLLFNTSIMRNISSNIKSINNNSIFIPISSFFNSRLNLLRRKTFINNSYHNKNKNSFSDLIFSLNKFQNFVHYYHYKLSNQNNKLNLTQYINKNINNINNFDKKWKLLSGLEKMKNLFNKYGYTSIITYITIYIATFISFWVLAINNILNASKIIKFISILKLDKHINSSKIEQKMETQFGKLFLAWISTKIVEPLRLISTITLTPYIYKLFKRSL